MSKGVAVVEKMMSLLRSTEDDYDLYDLREAKDKYFFETEKRLIIKCFMDTRLGGWDVITPYFPRAIKRLILNEVIDYCNHLTHPHHLNNSFARGFNKLDQDTIFALILECIQYCHRSFLKGRDLCFEFNVLVKTLPILSTKRIVQANITSTLNDHESIQTLSEDLSPHQTLFDTLLCENQANKNQEEEEYYKQTINDFEEAKKKQATQEYLRRQLYDSDEQGSGFSKLYSRRLKHLPLKFGRQTCQKLEAKLDPKNVEFCESCQMKIFIELHIDFLRITNPEIENWDFLRVTNPDTEIWDCNEGAGALIKPCPNSKLVDGLDILGRCGEKDDYSSGEDFLEAVKSGKLVEDGENQDTENCVVNEGACTWLKPCSNPELVDGFACFGELSSVQVNDLPHVQRRANEEGRETQ